MNIIAARKVLDTDVYIPTKRMATEATLAQLQSAIDNGTAKVWTQMRDGGKLLLHPPCNAQMWTPEFGRYDIQIKETAGEEVKTS